MALDSLSSVAAPQKDVRSPHSRASLTGVSQAQTPPQSTRSGAQNQVDVERIFFRAPRRTSTAQKIAAATLSRSGVKLYALLTSSFQLPATEVPDYSGLQPAAAAARLRLEWNLGSAVVPDLLHLLESHGVRVLRLPAHARSVGSFSFWDEGQAFIFLADADTPFQQRVDLAHELGHLVLHSALPTDHSDPGYGYRQAVDFALNLLLPQSSLKLRASEQLPIAQLLELQTHFGVPAALILSQLIDRTLIAESRYLGLAQELCMETAVPAALLKSTVFSLFLPSLCRTLRATSSHIAKELDLTAQELHELTFGQWFMSLSGGDESTTSNPRRTHLRVLSAPAQPHG